ncbi:hypothetical protein EST38_g14645, partial [Candolleomyces aberdarensis]
MKFFNYIFTALTVSLLPVVTAAGEHLNRNVHHQGVARRAEGHLLDKRQSQHSKWSWYDTQTGNAGSCGRHLQNSEFVVAMNVPQYQAGNCFKFITMSWRGKTTRAQIVDMCPGCPYGGLDLSPALFEFFAPRGMGIIPDGTWSFGDSDSGGYEDKQVGEKQKGKPGQKGNKTKKPKSVPILGDTDSESDVPTIPRPPPKLPPTQKPGQNVGEVKKKRRSNFNKFLPGETVALLQGIRARKDYTEQEKQEYDQWLEQMIKSNPAMKPKKGRSNINRAAVLLGPTLDPPTGLVLNKSPCDYCRDFCPFRCFVIDEGTSCLMCNYFRHTRCQRNGIQ